MANKWIWYILTHKTPSVIRDTTSIQSLVLSVIGGFTEGRTLENQIVILDKNECEDCDFRTLKKCGCGSRLWLTHRNRMLSQVKTGIGEPQSCLGCPIPRIREFWRGGSLRVTFRVQRWTWRLVDRYLVPKGTGGGWIQPIKRFSRVFWVPWLNDQM